jgi:hypothetical protein
VAGGGAFALLRSGPKTTLRLTFAAGRTLRYQVNSHDHGTGEAAGSQYDTKTEAPLAVAVGSVDPGGTATTTATVGPVTVRPSELEPSTIDALGPQRVRFAANGRQLDGILVVADPDGRFFSLMDPVLPFLPRDGVAPGDSWTVDARQHLAVGTGGTTFSGTATLARIDQGVAVVTADLTETWDLRAISAQVSSLAGGSAGGSGSVAWTGTEHLHMTSRLDLSSGVVLDSTVAGRYDLTISPAGGDRPLHNRGSFTQVARFSPS